jgi:hypothetical protein|tara:strand:+ start:1636 stop:1815 length:180 start_codon:yes stop_codon:yes gene_type:complete
MTKEDLLEFWLPHVYAVPIELLFLFKVEEPIEDWELRRDQYIKLILTFKKLNEKEKTYS